jgi:hypothetical protein
MPITFRTEDFVLGHYVVVIAIIVVDSNFLQIKILGPLKYRSLGPLKY